VAGTGFFCLELGHKVPLPGCRRLLSAPDPVETKRWGFLKPSVEELIAAKELNTEGFCVC